MKKHFLSFILLALTLGFSANAWAYSISNGSVTFAKDEVITLDFSGVTDFGKFQTYNEKIPVSPLESSNASFTITFSSEKTLSSGNEVFHWRHETNGNEWQHNNIEWFKLTSSGSSATDGIPCPDQTGYTILKITDGGTAHSACTFTWSTGSTPTPPSPSDPCANCKKITK